MTRLIATWTGAALALLFYNLAHATDVQPRMLDDFSDPAAWQIQATEQVRATLRSASGANGKAMCVDYDFNGVNGYASASRSLPLDFPADYAFELRVKGDGAPNDLQMKLVDASGDNVWWRNLVDFTPPPAWQPLTIKRRQIAFAWGPATDQRLRHSEKLELVLAAGKGGGKGSLCFDRLSLREIGAPPVHPAAPEVTASSGGASAHLALDGKHGSAWSSDAGAAQTLTLDFHAPREFGGAVLHWGAGRYASRYRVELSDDALQWRTVRTVIDGNGGDDPLDLPESDARYLRLTMEAGPAQGYELAEIEIMPLAFGASTNAFVTALAKRAPRGRYPRAFLGQQSYWTMLGVDGGPSNGLISEDGAIEAHAGRWSVEPFLIGDGAVYSWADSAPTQTLHEGYLPMPHVTWRAKDVGMEVSAFASGTAQQAQILARYTLRNLTRRTITRTLALALRPFQVNPPSQFLNIAGGSADIGRIDWDNAALSVDGEAALRALSAPSKFIGAGFDAGQIGELLEHAASAPAVARVEDANKRASGALLYPFTLAPGASAEVVIALPLFGAPHAEAAPGQSASAYFAAQEELVAAEWRAKLNRVSLRLPADQKRQFDVMRSALAHLLISRAGPALQPGTRSYARSWVRDGAMMADALLRLDHAGVASDFVEWIAPFQFESGKMPCCVDRRGADPVPENDSHGELIFAIADLYRYTGDRAQLAHLWPHVERAVAYMEQLRLSEQSAANRGTALYGLMPASISHEGYSAKAMHSYWDDFWALRGYKDAALLANALGRTAQAEQLARQRDAFQADLKASIAASAVRHKIGFVPGAAELGDFDATSTTIALAPAEAADIIAPAQLAATFERYWREFVARRANRTWDAYTPYEVRTVGAFTRLGWGDRAQQALHYFYGDLRPAGWNQWAEVVGREYRKQRFIGDMPHAWVASDYLRALLDGYAWEDGAAHSVVLAAALPQSWLTGDGIGVRGLRTSYGELNYTLRTTERAVLLHVDGGMRVPQGGLVYAIDPSTLARSSTEGAGWRYADGMLRIASLPVDVALQRARH